MTASATPLRLFCSFCGKSQYEVAKLIAGPAAFICDECVDLCREIVDEARVPAPALTPAQEARIREVARDEIDAASARSATFLDDLKAEALVRAEALVVGTRPATLVVPNEDGPPPRPRTFRDGEHHAG